MVASHERGGYRWRKIAAKFKTECQRRNDQCWLCREPIDYDAPPQTASAFEADHYRPASTHPQLALIMGNLRASHSSCNRSRGTKTVESNEWVAANF